MSSCRAGSLDGVLVAAVLIADDVLGCPVVIAGCACSWTAAACFGG